MHLLAKGGSLYLALLNVLSKSNSLTLVADPIGCFGALGHAGRLPNLVVNQAMLNRAVNG